MEILAAVNASLAAKPHIRGKSKDRNTLLVIDDDAFYLEDVVFFLKDAGFNVIAASTADEAIDVISSRSAEIDIVLLDLMMRRPESGALASYLRDTEETGVGIARWVKERCPDMPIVGVSAKNRPEAEAEWFGQHGTGYLQKPLSAKGIEELIAIISGLRDK